MELFREESHYTCIRGYEKVAGEGKIENTSKGSEGLNEGGRHSGMM